MTVEEREKWQYVRSKGRINFIFVRGVLLTGLILTLIFSFALICLRFITNNFTFSYFDINFARELLFFLFFSLPLGGILAWQIWCKKEKELARKRP